MVVTLVYIVYISELDALRPLQYLYLCEKKADDFLPYYCVHKPSNVCRLSKYAQCLKNIIMKIKYVE